MSSFYNGSLNKPCILDLGNTTTKIGYAGEDSPLMYWDSLVHVDGASVSRELGVPRIKGGLNQSVNRPERGETPDEDGLWSRTVGDGLVGLYGEWTEERGEERGEMGGERGGGEGGEQGRTAGARLRCAARSDSLRARKANWGTGMLSRSKRRFMRMPSAGRLFGSTCV